MSLQPARQLIFVVGANKLAGLKGRRMVRSREARRFLKGHPRVIESYLATCHGRGVFQEKLSIRVDRYRDRCEATGHVLELRDDLEWHPTATHARRLAEAELTQVQAWVEVDFWQQPTHDEGGAVRGGDCWLIEGFRRDVYHSVYRHTGHLLDGTGVRVYELGKRLAQLVGFQRFDSCNFSGSQTEDDGPAPTIASS